MADRAAEKAGSKPDLATIGGLVIGFGGILGGLILEGGNVREIVAPTALLIVLGGTAGAVMVTTPMSVLKNAFQALAGVFFEKSQPPEAMIDQIVELATKARKNGIVSLEQDASDVADPFLRKALTLAVDGTDLQELRKMMELAIGLDEHHAEAEAKVFEGAGGYAPTIGIIGAVMGLIQVMKDLADIEKVGHGIATAFVATIYGVGFSNLLLLPAGSKIKARAQISAEMKELMLEGVVGIVEGLNPKLIRTKLEAYVQNNAVKEAKGGRPVKAARGVAG
ncbi:MAG: flagellar motor protein [Bryobacteraceae bacterium]